MRVALVDSTPRAKLYSLPLMKIGAWRKSLGDEVRLFGDRLPRAGDFDQIWVTTTFTFDMPHALGIVREARNRAGVVRVGGIAASLFPEAFERQGAEVHRGLLPEAEAFHPDYGLLGFTPEYSISHTSRGCVRKCGFCMVHRLESEFMDRPEWAGDLDPRARRVLFYDNNWLAKDQAALERDVATMRRLVKIGQVHLFDFNQGLDCRLMTEDLAALLEGLPIHPVRFSFDGMHEDGYFQRAIEMMAARGFRSFTNYVLYNFKDSPQDFYYRLRECIRLRIDHQPHLDLCAFPMRYQPITEIDAKRGFVGDKWTATKKAAYMTLQAKHGTTGQISTDSWKEFEYWFGKDAREFDRMLSYPKARGLLSRRQGAIRLSRAAKK